MEIISELMYVLAVTMVAIAILYGGFCVKHAKQNKNETNFPKRSQTEKN